jgi:uncharacterized protein (DUF2141 family)
MLGVLDAKEGRFVQSFIAGSVGQERFRAVGDESGSGQLHFDLLGVPIELQYFERPDLAFG